MDKDIYSADEVKIHYNLSENFNPKNSLVLLHGLGGDLTALDPLRELLHTKGYSTLAIDIRGQGLSGRPRDKDAYQLKNLVNDVIQVTKEEKLETITLIGHCFGGMVAIAASVQLKDTVKKLILVDTSYQAPRFGRILNKVPFIRDGLFAIGRYFPTIYLKGEVNYAKYKGGSDFSIWRITSDILHTSVQSYIRLSETLVRLNIKDILKNITIPTLIIEGANDRVYSLRVAKELQALIPQSKLVVIPKANHILVISNVSEVFETVDSFLS